MNRRFLIVMMVLLVLVGLMVSCKNDIEINEEFGEELVSVTFVENSGASRGLSANLEVFEGNIANYYWGYAAKKSAKDTSNMKRGETPDYSTKVVWLKTSGSEPAPGLSDNPIPGFSQGYWDFRLCAYKKVVGDNPSTTEVETDYVSYVLVYQGETKEFLLKSSSTNESGNNLVTVTVNPVSLSGQNGTLIIKTTGTDAIKLNKVDIDSEYGTNYFPRILSVESMVSSIEYVGTVAEKTKASTEADGVFSLPAGSYKITFAFADSATAPTVNYAKGSIVATVYSNLDTTIKGDLTEMTTSVTIGPELNPELETVTVSKDNISYDSTPGTQTVSITTDTSAAKAVTAEIKKTDTNNLITTLAEKINTNTTDYDQSLKLTLKVETVEAEADTATYEIGMSAKLTNTNTTTQEQTSTTSDVTSVADYVTVTVQLQTGFTEVVVFHSGVKMNGGVDVNIDQVEDTGNVGKYSYNSANGVLTIQTKTFSPFKVSFVVPDETTYVAQIGNVKYQSLSAAIDKATSGDTIIILKDITTDDGYSVDKPLNIDTNGKTITVNVGSNVDHRAFRIDSGKLTVFGGGKIVAVGSGTTSSNGTGCYGAFRVEANGQLEVSDMTLTNARPWGLNVKVLGGEATLTNVTINSSYGGGIEVSEADLGGHSKAGSATLTDCSFTQTGYFDHCSTPLSVSGGSKLIINSGSYSGEYGLYVFSSGGEIEVKGGSFTGKSKDVLIAAIDTKTYPQYEGGFKISGGLFYGTFSITSPAYLSITGGTYNTDPSAYVDSGYQVLDSGDSNYPYKVFACNDVLVGNTTMSLAEFRNSVNAGNPYVGQTVKLLRDIDLAGVDWTPIGTEEHPFRGLFNGNGYTISNFIVSGSNYYAALFGYVEGVANSVFVDYIDIWIENKLDESNIVESKYSAAIKNLNVSGANCSSNKKYAAGLVAFANDTYIYNCSVANSTISTGKIAGGLIGAINGCIVKNCTTAADVSVTATSYHAGGLIGAVNYYNGSDKYPSIRMESAVISSTSNSTITNANNGGDGGAFGGIIALFNAATDYGSVVYDCENKGNITIDNSNCSSQYRSSIGGIVGSGQGVAVLSDCKNSGSVTVVSNYNSSNTGADYYNKVGGIIGQMGNTAKIVGLINCVNSADISATVSSDRNIIGGLVASISPNSTQNASIINCGNSGIITCKDSQAENKGYVSNMVAEVYNNSGAVEYRNMQFGNLAALSNAIPKRAIGYDNAKVVIDSSVIVTDKSGVLTISGDVRRLKAYDGLCTRFRFEGSLLGTSGTTRSAYVDIPNAKLIVGENETLTCSILDLVANGMGIINYGTIYGGVELFGVDVTVINRENGRFEAHGGNLISLHGGSGTVHNYNSTNPFGSGFGGVKIMAVGTYTVTGVTPWVSSDYEMTKNGDEYTVVAKNN